MSCREILSLPFVIALCISIGLKLLLIFSTPVDPRESRGILVAYNDEAAHGQYVEHVLRTGSLPQQVAPIDPQASLHDGQFENYQPPLYYLAVAALGRTVGLHRSESGALFATIFFGRILNFVLSFLCILVWLAVARAWELSPSVQAAGAIFLSLNGMFVRFGTTATNDMLLWLFAGLMLWALHVLSEKNSLAVLIAWITFTNLGFYTKASALALYGILLLGWIWRKPELDKRIFAAAAILPLLLSLPVWLRNVQDFGALIPLSAGFGTPELQWPTMGTLSYAVRSFFNPYQESWSGLADLLTMVLFALPIVWFLRTWKTLRPMSRQWSIALVITSLLAFIYLNVNYRQAEAKYLLFAWPGWLMFFVSGATTVTRQWLLLGASIAAVLPLLFHLGAMLA